MGNIPKFIADVLPVRLRDKNIEDLRGKFAERAQNMQDRRQALVDAGELPESDHNTVTPDDLADDRAAVVGQPVPVEQGGPHPVDGGVPDAQVVEPTPEQVAVEGQDADARKGRRQG